MTTILRISPSSGGELLLDDEGRWAVMSGEGPRPLSDPKNHVGVFPLLEEPFADFSRRLEQAIRDLGVDADASSFPATAIARTALESPLSSSYWKEHAVSWAEVLAGPGSDLLAGIDAIANGPWPWPLRKKARRIRDAIRK